METTQLYIYEIQVCNICKPIISHFHNPLFPIPIVTIHLCLNHVDKLGFSILKQPCNALNLPSLSHYSNNESYYECKLLAGRWGAVYRPQNDCSTCCSIASSHIHY